MKRAGLGTWVWIGSVAALAACYGATPAPTRSSPAAPVRAPLDEARAYERGAGIPRDYRRAAEIYARECKEGTGDRVACRRWLFAISVARGAKKDLPQLREIA